MIKRPLRDPDMISKRGVPYWFAPEWIRATSSAAVSFGQIKAIKENGRVVLHMVSKSGNTSYIQGSIQEEFRKWHEDRKIDLILFGEDPDAADDIIINDVE